MSTQPTRWRRFWRRITGRPAAPAGVPLELAPAALPAKPRAGAQYSFSDSLDRLARLSPTIAELSNLLTAYDQADWGDPSLQCDYFERQVEMDPHLRSVADERIEGVARKQWAVAPGGDADEDKAAAAALDAGLRQVSTFPSSLEHQLTANGFGYAATEMTWQLTEDLVLPVEFTDVPHRRIRFGAGDRPRLVTDVGDSEGAEFWPGKWWYTRRRGRLAAAAGLFRTAAVWSHFKSLGVRDWMVFMDRFGLPYVVGQYAEHASPESKATLEQAVAQLGGDGWAVMSDACKIVFEATKGGGGADSVHSRMVELCDSQISKLIAGATLVNQSGGPGSFALGQVHQNRSYDLKRGDAEWLATTFVECVAMPFMRFNGLSGRPPRLEIYLQLDVSILEQCRIASICANELGMAIDEDQMRRITALRPPTGAALRGTKAGAAGIGQETLARLVARVAAELGHDIDSAAVAQIAARVIEEGSPM